MTTGDEIRAARERAGLTQQQLGDLVGVSMRTVGNWERATTVPRNRLAKIRDVLDTYVDSTRNSTSPLQLATDVELLAEIARRFARDHDERAGGEHADSSAPRTDAGTPPAHNELREAPPAKPDHVGVTDTSDDAKVHTLNPPDQGAPAPPTDVAARDLGTPSRGQQTREGQDADAEQSDRFSPDDDART